MADITIRGIIDNIHILPNGNGGILQVSEFRRGFRKSNGEVIEDRYISWKVIFKKGQASYLNKHFNVGMLVKVKGDVLPYAVERNEVVDGYTVLMDSCTMDSYPRSNLRMEVKMMKDSQSNSYAIPDIDEYNKKDF